MSEEVTKLVASFCLEALVQFRALNLYYSESL